MSTRNSLKPEELIEQYKTSPLISFSKKELNNNTDRDELVNNIGIPEVVVTSAVITNVNDIENIQRQPVQDVEKQVFKVANVLRAEAMLTFTEFFHKLFHGTAQIELHKETKIYKYRAIERYDQDFHIKTQIRAWFLIYVSTGFQTEDSGLSREQLEKLLNDIEESPYDHVKHNEVGKSKQIFQELFKSYLFPGAPNLKFDHFKNQILNALDKSSGFEEKDRKRIRDVLAIWNGTAQKWQFNPLFLEIYLMMVFFSFVLLSLVSSSKAYTWVFI